MSFFLTLFKSSLRSQLSNWRGCLLLLLPLTAFAAARLLPPEEVSAPVQVGVVLPAEGGGDFWARLDARSGLVVTFHQADYDQAERQVATGRWDCALLLPRDFEDRLARLETEELFTLLIAPGSAVYPLVRETVSACVAELVSPGIAEKYLLDSGISGSGGLDAARPRLHEALPDGERVLVSMETADGRPLDPLTMADSGVSALLTGLVALLLLLWTLFTALDLRRWLATPFARRLLPLRGMRALLLPRLAAALLPALCAGALALLAAA